MNCEQCKEQVFELIDQETVDPVGVRELLERCPDCRAAFDEMKAALALADQLPMETPPAALDDAILRAARECAPRVVPLRKRILQPPPWAMAAIALLAVGVGVWTIPEGAQPAPDLAPAVHAPVDKKNAEGTTLKEERVAEPVEEEAKLDARIAGPSPPPPAPRGEPADARANEAAPKLARAKRRSRPAVGESSAGRAEQAPATLPAADMAVEFAAGSEADDRQAKAAVADEQERDDDEGASAACKRKVTELERRTRTGKGPDVTPEEELAIGQCYAVLENLAEARKWLGRAATRAATKARAQEALRELAPE